MSVLYLESFGADIGDIDAYGKLGHYVGTGTSSIGQAAGRWMGSRCFAPSFGNVYGDAGSAAWYVDLQMDRPTLFFGWAYQMGISYDLFTLLDSAGATQLRIVPDSFLVPHVYAGPLLADRFAFDRQIYSGRWHYCEIGIHVSATAGWIEARLDSVLTGAWYGTGTSRATANANTMASAIPGVRQVYFGKVGGNATSTGFGVQDVVILNDVDSGIPGRPNNNFLGDLPVAWLAPSAPGAHTDFTPGGTTTLATDWQSVKNPHVQGDVTFVTAATAGNEDTYAVAGSPPGANGLYALQPGLVVRKEGAGKRQAGPIARWAAGPTDQLIGPAAGFPLTASYGYFGGVSEGRPDGNPWTQTDVAAMQLGVRIVS